jgi:hypothetical protein
MRRFGARCRRARAAALAATAALAAAAACTPRPPAPALPADAPVAYPVHGRIVATVYWVGEPADADNDFISNDASAWDEQWKQHFGGVDDPAHRQHGGSWPAGFTPLQNPFYFALPYGEYTDAGVLKSNVDRVYWYDPQHRPKAGQSVLRARWVRVSMAGKAAYAQWGDVGPFRSDEVDYVFGTAAPGETRAGIDLSPAVAHYLGVPGRGVVSWQFVEASDVPTGPWAEIVTRADEPAQVGGRGHGAAK